MSRGWKSARLWLAVAAVVIGLVVTLLWRMGRSTPFDTNHPALLAENGSDQLPVGDTEYDADPPATSSDATESRPIGNGVEASHEPRESTLRQAWEEPANQNYANTHSSPGRIESPVGLAEDPAVPMLPLNADPTAASHEFGSAGLLDPSLLNTVLEPPVQVEVFKAYLPVVQAKMALLGIELETPPVSGPRRGSALYITLAGGRGPAVSLGCSEWGVIIDERAHRILSYLDDTHIAQEAKRAEDLQANGEEGWAEYAKPRMSANQAIEAFQRLQPFGPLDVDTQALGLGKPDIAFSPSADYRGWKLTFRRTYKGYPFHNEVVRFILDDETGQMNSYEYNISPMTPPEPTVSLTKEDVRRLVGEWFEGDSPIPANLRNRGFMYDPASLVIESPQYVHVNGYLSGNSEDPDLTADNGPLALAYVCRAAAGKAPFTRRFVLYIDTQTGELIGGDVLL